MAGYYDITYTIECSNCGQGRLISKRERYWLLYQNQDKYNWTYTKDHKSLCPECSEKLDVSQNPVIFGPMKGEWTKGRYYMIDWSIVESKLQEFLSIRFDMDMDIIVDTPDEIQRITDFISTKMKHIRQHFTYNPSTHEFSVNGKVLRIILSEKGEDLHGSTSTDR